MRQALHPFLTASAGLLTAFWACSDGGAAWGMEAEAQVALRQVRPNAPIAAEVTQRRLPGESSEETAEVQSNPFAQPVWGQISGGSVNVRTGPGTEHTVIITLRGGDYIQVTGRQGGWLQIEWPRKAPAWVSQQFVSPKGEVLANKVRIRAQGNLRAPILHEANAGDQLEILGAVADWYQVKAPTQAKAFLFAKYALLGVRPPEGASHQPPPVAAPKNLPAPALPTPDPQAPSKAAASQPSPREVAAGPATAARQEAQPATAPRQVDTPKGLPAPESSPVLTTRPVLMAIRSSPVAPMEAGEPGKATAPSLPEESSLHPCTPRHPAPATWPVQSSSAPPDERAARIPSAILWGRASEAAPAPGAPTLEVPLSASARRSSSADAAALRGGAGPDLGQRPAAGQGGAFLSQESRRVEEPRESGTALPEAASPSYSSLARGSAAILEPNAAPVIITKIQTTEHVLPASSPGPSTKPAAAPPKDSFGELLPPPPGVTVPKEVIQEN